MAEYQVTIFAEVRSALSETELEKRLVISLFDMENEIAITDGQSPYLEVIDYHVTEARSNDIQQR